MCNKTNYILLNAGQKYCKGSILQYFRPSISYHLSLRSLSFFECLFYTGFTVYVFIVWMKNGVYPDQLASYLVDEQRAQLLHKST